MSSFQISRARLKQIIREEQGNLAKATPLTEFTEQGDKSATQYVVNRLEARGFDLAVKAVMAEDEMQMGGYNRENVRAAAMDILDRITQLNSEAKEPKDTKKYDDSKKLKGDQDGLPDELQKAIIKKGGGDPEEEEEEEKNESLDLEHLIRQEILAAISGE